MKRQIITTTLFALLVGFIVEIGVGYTIERNYQWNCKEETWTWTLYVDSQTYQFYKDLPRVDDLSIYVTTPYDDRFLTSLVDSLKQSARGAGYDEWDTVNFLISFVQSLPYTSDKISTGYDEYPRYPIETLVDNGGDCEDTAILTAALLWQMGYDVILLKYPDHVAVGVAGDETINGTYYEYNGRKYFYLETTGEGWEIGEMPDALPSVATIVPLSPKPLLSFSWQSKPWKWNYANVIYRVRVTVNNYGSDTSYRTICYVALESDRTGYVWDQQKSIPTAIAPLESVTWTVYLKAPREKRARFLITVWSNNHPEISDTSRWFKL